MDPKTEVLITRHSIKPTENDQASEKYEGISESGVELARRRAKDIAQILEESNPATVLFVLGTSNLLRTKSTARIYSEELIQIFKDRPEYLVLTKETIESNLDNNANKVKRFIRQHPDQKIIVCWPLFVKEFSDPGNGFAEKNGEIAAFYTALENKHKKDADAMFHDWLKTRGRISNDLIGPDPTTVGRNFFINGVGKMRKLSPENRGVIFVINGQSWSSDSGITYAAEGKVDMESFEKVAGGHIIEETELAQISISSDKVKVKYRGQEFTRDIPKA